MPLFSRSPFEELIVQATSEQNVSENWSAIMDICDKAVNYEDGAKICLQAITKRLSHKVPRVVMQALVLLDACIQNCGKKFHLEVSSRSFVTEIQKLLPKMHASAADKLKQLLKRWSENEFKDDPELGLIPSLYYKLRGEGVEFPPEKEERPPPRPVCSDPNVVSSQQEEEDIIKAIALSLDSTQSSPIKEDTTDSSSTSSAATTSDPLKVRALYDFEAVEENELTIKAGEIVLILDRSNSSWWKGSNHRGEGYLPSNFVTENLDEKADLQSPDVDEEQTLPKQVDDSIEEVTAIDEEKIQKALDWLNEIDPTGETEDPEELLKLERQSYAMAPLIEEKLQKIDKKCSVLNSLNEQLMEAVQLFYGLDSTGNVPSGAAPERYPTRDITTPASTVTGQPTYVVPPQYMIKTTGKSPSSAATLPAQPHFIPVEALPSQQMLYQNLPQTSFPPYCYQPVYAMLPPEAEPQYQVMVTGVPEQQKGQPSTVPTTSHVPQPTQSSTASNESTSNPVVNNNSNAYSTSALPNTGGMPVVYQPVVLQHPMTHSSAGGLTYATYPRNMSMQQPGAVMHPQAMNPYMPQYIAQVVMPGDSNLQDASQPVVHQNTSTELPPNLSAADSSQQAPVTQTVSDEISTPISGSVTASLTSAVSNPECGVKSAN